MASGGWEQLGLDPRVVRAVERCALESPTVVQARAIPHVLSGSDVVVTAPTGTGKTLSYALPLLNQVVQSSEGSTRLAWQGLVLIPTSELCEQVRREIDAVARLSGEDVSVTSVAPLGPSEGNKRAEARLKASCSCAGHIVVTTLSALACAMRVKAVGAQVIHASLRMLVLDEADLILSYETKEDFELLSGAVSKRCQRILLTATMSEEMKAMQRLLMHNPVVLELDGATGKRSVVGAGCLPTHLEHFVLDVSEADKMLACMALIRFRLVKTKVLMFVNTVEQGYRLKLFLEAFSLRACLLNSELPKRSRQNALDHFNKGVFDVMIAVDGPGVDDAEGDSTSYSRGVDFKNVLTVINLSPPETVASYVHRVGRTARGGKHGVAVSLCTPAERSIVNEIENALREGWDTNAGSNDGRAMKLFSALEESLLQGLRYRASDIASSLTRTVVQEARLRDLRGEILQSDRMVAHFESNRDDLDALRHDKPLASQQLAPRRRALPSYVRQRVKGRGGVAGKTGIRKKRTAKDPLKTSFVIGQEGASIMEVRAARRAKKEEKKMRRKR